MELTSISIEKNRGKAVFATLMALSFLVVSLFWAVIQLLQLNGLPVYFMQLGLYLILYLFAWWGLRQERASLPVNTRMLVEALAWSLVGWLLFVLIIQLLGLTRLSDEFQVLKNTPAWKIGAQILSTWFFVALGEELLFRGYFLRSFLRHFTRGTDKRRTVVAALFVSLAFSLWHFPSRVIWLITGEVDIVMFMISFLVLFVLGLGYSYLFIRSNNIVLAGLVHGVSDFPLVGMASQMAPIILVVAIGCVEIARLTTHKKVNAFNKAMPSMSERPASH